MNDLSQECIKAGQCKRSHVTIEAPLLALQTMNTRCENFDSDTQEKSPRNHGSNRSNANERIDYLYIGRPEMMKQVSSTTPNQLQKSVRTDTLTTFDEQTYCSRSSSVPPSLRHDSFDSSESRHSVNPKQSELIMCNNRSQSKSSSHNISSAAVERLYNTHNAVSDQKREDSPSPRCRSTRDSFYDITGSGHFDVSSKTRTVHGIPPTSPSHTASSAVYDRLYSTHTAVSDQKRRQSPSPRSRSTSTSFYNGIRGDFRNHIGSTAESIGGNPPTSPSRIVPSALYDRLHSTHTTVSNQKRKQSPSPRSRSTSTPFYNGVRGDFRNHIGSTAGSINGNPPTSPSRFVSSALYDRLHSTHTTVSDQKRKQTPSPRSRSSQMPFYNGIRGDFRKYLKTQEPPVHSPDGFSFKIQSPRARSNSRNNSSNMPSNVRSSSVPTSLSSAFDRLHASPTKVSKTKEEYRKQCRERIEKIIKMREMSRNGECRKDYGTIPSSRACDMYYRGMADLVKKEIQVAKHSKKIETKMTVDQLVRYSEYMLKEREEANINNDK